MIRDSGRAVIKNIKRVIAGRLSQRKGALFEKIVHIQAYKNGWVVIPIPDSARQVSAHKMIRVRSPFDMIMVKNNRVVFCDIKCTKNKVFSFSAMTSHQVNLLKSIEDHGFKSGYIINFESLNQTVYFGGKALHSLRSRASLKPDEGILIGTTGVISLDKIFATKELDLPIVQLP